MSHYGAHYRPSPPWNYPPWNVHELRTRIVSARVAIENRNGAMTRRILNVYRSADAQQIAAGMIWYETAHNEALKLSAEFSLSIEQTAGIIAALSPQVSWGFNLEWARAICERDRTQYGLSLSQGRAEMIRYNPDIPPLDILGGPKVRAFYACIESAGMTDTVCVDRHACDIATGLRGSFNSLTDRRIRIIQAAYVSAARRLAITGGPVLSAAQLQAITWITWRARYWSAGAFDTARGRAPITEEVPF